MSVDLLPSRCISGVRSASASFLRLLRLVGMEFIGMIIRYVDYMGLWLEWMFLCGIFAVEIFR